MDDAEFGVGRFCGCSIPGLGGRTDVESAIVARLRVRFDKPTPVTERPPGLAFCRLGSLTRQISTRRAYSSNQRGQCGP